MERKFRQFEQEVKFEEEIIKKNHKMTMKLDHEAIKAHSKAYLTKVEERNANKSHSPQSADGSRENFNQFLGRN